MLALLLILACAACRESSPICDIPDEGLILALADLHLAEAAAQHLVGPLKDSTLQTYYRQVFDIHSMDEEAFRICFEELQKDPERLNLFYEKVLEELSRQGVQVEKN